jgi:hypothetical protein
MPFYTKHQIVGDAIQ